jgi:hypothetical protein
VPDPGIEFLTVDDALEVARLVTGEPARVRDFADLHAALARPQQTEDGREPLPHRAARPAGGRSRRGRTRSHSR